MSELPTQPELKVGGAVPIGTHIYIARPTDDELLRNLLRGEYCSLVCPRQMGKTSAICRIRRKLEEQGVHTASIDIAGRIGTPENADNWYLALLSELNGQLGLGCNVKAWWASQGLPTANQKLLSFYRKKMLGQFPYRFVILLDEIDHTLNLPYTDDFFLAIRSLYNERAVEPDLCRLAFCLVGVFTPNELVKQRGTTTFNVGRTIEFQDFDPERDDLSPLAQTLSSDPALGRALLDAVLKWTDGQPYLTASACKKIASAGIASLEAAERLILDAFVDRARPREDSDEIHFETIGRYLANRTTVLREAEDLYRSILAGEIVSERSTPQTVALKLSGLVKSDDKGRLIVRNEIYRRRFDKSWALLGLSLAERSADASPVQANANARPRMAKRTQRYSPLCAIRKTVGTERRPNPDGSGAIFISHTSVDDRFIRALQRTLADMGQDPWMDSRELGGGDHLSPAVAQAIEHAGAYLVLVTPAALQSKWVAVELRHALNVRKRRGNDRFPIVLLSLDGTGLGVLETIFEEEPIYVSVSSQPGGIESALDSVLVALGKRLPSDRTPSKPQPEPEPLEELILELTDLKFHEQGDGTRRASARARLVYEPANPGYRGVESHDSWRLIAPMGPIESEELRWYLEKYAIWPSSHFRDRARRIEVALVEWGQRLYEAALQQEHAANVLAAWSQMDAQAGRRLSIYVDAGTPLDRRAPQDATGTASECATALLALPWELLHDGRGFLLQAARPTRVRRRLTNDGTWDRPALAAAPIRILLVVARPEDEACGYIDHRASALPLVETMEDLGGLVDLRLLEPPTFPALSAELQRAYDEGTPYHCVHFDGHGIYDRRVGLGGLCLEDPRDRDRPDGRRHLLVHTDTLGSMLRDRRIPLVFLEACQSAQVQDASESVAAGLLKVGVGSVVAMSHSVLVETARRFVLAFYGALAAGKRVGDAMLEGQRGLKDDAFRGQVFGVGELRLADWFVPVLFQGQDDPPLFAPADLSLAPQVREDLRTILRSRLGALPDPPETGFVGRSRDLLALERMLRPRAAGAPKLERWALIRGQGGEGKTALACELARWLVRSGQVRRTAFVSVESHSHAAAVLDALGRQLASQGYSVAGLSGPEGDLEPAILPIERALAEQPTLLVIDSLESILPPPYLAQESPKALREDAREALAAILALCDRLLAKGDTRLIFTSRETLPAPFAAEPRCRELVRLAPEDAVRLVERALEGGRDRRAGAADDAARESVDALVETVHGHARTLALLGASLRAFGVERTRARLTDLMAEMDRRFPGSRERSVFASVELSLERLAPANRERAAVLGVFHGGVQLDMLRDMTGWEQADCAALAEDLSRTGLATADPYNHLTLNPALCPYLRGRLGPAEMEALAGRWVESMGQYVESLVQQQSRQAEIAATLTVLGLPNLFALLDRVQSAGDAESTIALATSLYTLLQWLGRPRLLARVGEVRDAAARSLEGQSRNDWTHARFEARRNRIEQQLDGGRLRESLADAEALLGRARTAGETAYPGADYDLAMAGVLLARLLKTAGGPEAALTLLDDSRRRFETIVKGRASEDARRMTSSTLFEQGDCLLHLGRLDESSSAYQEAIARAEQRGGERDIAVGKVKLGNVRLMQRRYVEALDAYVQSRERFARLDEPGSVAAIWHQTGMAYQQSGNPESAEDAYRRSLAIELRLGNTAGQASTLLQLGNLYLDGLSRPEDAAAFYRQSADLFVQIGDATNEGRVRSNLADTLRRLRRIDEARREIVRAIECKAQFGHAAEPWKTWDILARLETDAGNPDPAAAARSKAVGAYLDYRRAGGENYDSEGRIALAVTQQLRARDPAHARALLAGHAQARNLPEDLRPFLQSLDALCTGSRDPALAHAPGLDYSMSAEILLLIETLPPS